MAGMNTFFLQFGFVLPDAPGTDLEDFKDDDGEIQLNLVRPEEPPRSKPRTITSDKARYVLAEVIFMLS